jgi:hypothetical protein
MAAFFQIVRDTFTTINMSGQVMGLFLAAVIFLFMIDNRKNRMLFGYCILALILIFNPFTANNLISFYFPWYDYWQVFLLLPVIAVCAYVFVEVTGMQKNRRNQWIVAAALIVIVLMSGGLLSDGNGLTRNTNRAYIDEEYLELFSKMNMEGEPIVLLANDDIMDSARAYSQYIGLPYEVTLMNQSEEVTEQFFKQDLITVHQQIQQPAFYLGNITTVARKYQCNYLILPLDSDDRAAMESGGYMVLKETEGYVLYYDTGESDE